ncbi:MAG: glutaredoxin domain-containing protein [Acetobacterium sp.]
MKNVTLLTTKTCSYCKMAKDFLKQNHIQFVEKDINFDSEARNELTRRNIKGVPTFLIGEDVVVGLDKEKILELVDHRIVECQNCKTKLRVPTNKGTINVRCPKCKNSVGSH